MTYRNVFALRWVVAMLLCCMAALPAMAQNRFRLADAIVKYQMRSGGWAKNQDWLQGPDKSYVVEWERTGVGSTIDNGATVKEMRELASVCLFIDSLVSYGIARLDAKSMEFKRQEYNDAFLRGLDYLLAMQMSNGGWPQYFPERKGVDYASQITFNDNAMVGVMTLLSDIANYSKEFQSVKITKGYRRRCQKAFERGVRCILNCQIRVDENGNVLQYKTPEWKNGKRTVWGQQHDNKTLLPCKARSYELPCYVGQGETAEILLMLMRRSWYDREVRSAVGDAVAWLESHSIKGKKVVDFFNEVEKRKDRKLVDDDTAPLLWARCYDLETAQPMFCGRDGVPKRDLSEIEIERRTGYQWVGAGPQKAIDEYKALK